MPRRRATACCKQSPLTHAATAALHVTSLASGLLLSQSVRNRKAQFLTECMFSDFVMFTKIR